MIVGHEVVATRLLWDEMSVRFHVVSIGTLSRNRFWNESHAVRAAHATTTLVRDEDELILVDPSVPAELMQHRLDEQAGVKPAQINVVFLTTFRPVHRRSLSLFDKADWLMHTVELEAMRSHLQTLAAAAEASGRSPDQLVQEEIALLERIRAAPDKLTPCVHLFPSPGPTHGASSLLLVPPTRTIALAGDVVINRDYFEHGQVFEQCADADRARESFAELVEIADIIVPGHDNVIVTGA